MPHLFTAVIFLGLVHPGSKFLLDSGLTLLPFCFSFLLVKTLLQAPFAFATGAYKIKTRQQFLLLFLLGATGASLHFLEFQGIAAGVSVPVTSFLLYSYPLYILFFDRMINSNTITKQHLLNACLALAGITFISGAASEIVFSKQLWAPLLSSVAMAFWICLSKYLKNLNYPSLTMSFYYDLFGLILTAPFVLSTWQASDTAWLNNPSQLLQLIFYATLTAIIPNLLLYQACQTVSAYTLSLGLLFEPILASLVSFFVWNDQLAKGFYIGSALVLLANLPKGRSLIRNKKRATPAE